MSQTAGKPQGGKSTEGAQRLAVAIVAMGGQGGGVLSDWIRATAENNGWIAQTTSVPGVAQRTGATIYYVELFNKALDASDEPVLALMPLSGDVDLVVAAEWMETGRAIMRGLVTPDRTTLVASTHRSYAPIEKIVPGNGIADPRAVGEAAQAAAKKVVAFDMAAVAKKHGTVISASLLGAVAGAGTLPYSRESFEQAITSGGIGVEASLNAFAAAFEQAQAQDVPVRYPEEESVAASDALSGQTGEQLGGPLGERVSAELPLPAQAFAVEGVRRCIDYLDGDYAGEYLDRLKRIADQQSDPTLLSEVARWLALRMCYEDPIRVADLKIRGHRVARIRSEVQAGKKQLMHQTEYLHPRIEEIADTLPAAWGQRLLDSTHLRKWVAASMGKGRKIRTSTLSGFLLMYGLAAFRGRRRGSLRHAREIEHIDQWLGKMAQFAPKNPALATSVARLARLIKGYGDTHANGMAVFTRLSGIADRLADRADGGAQLDTLIEATMADASGKALDAAIAHLDQPAVVKAAPPSVAQSKVA